MNPWIGILIQQPVYWRGWGFTPWPRSLLLAIRLLAALKRDAAQRAVNTAKGEFRRRMKEYIAGHPELADILSEWAAKRYPARPPEPLEEVPILFTLFPRGADAPTDRKAIVLDDAEVEWQADRTKFLALSEAERERVLAEALAESATIQEDGDGSEDDGGRGEYEALAKIAHTQVRNGTGNAGISVGPPSRADDEWEDHLPRAAWPQTPDPLLVVAVTTGVELSVAQAIYDAGLSPVDLPGTGYIGIETDRAGAWSAAQVVREIPGVIEVLGLGEIP